MKKKMVAVIPARGGSKRLPRKNILPFCGRPMLAWTVKVAIETGLFERVIVSTEDEEISKVAIEAGAEVDVRRPELASDTAKVAEVCLDLLNREKQKGRSYDVLCCLYATAPLRNTQDIVLTVEKVGVGKANYAVAVTKYDLPPHQALKVIEEELVIPMWPELVNERSDVIGELVVDNGSTYAVNVAEFKKTPGFFGEKLAVHVMPKERSIDIDEIDDFELALYHANKIGFRE